MQTKFETLRDQIHDLISDAPTGLRIPAERELCERFGVARETLRKALDDLARDGYLVRRQGAGTFVARPKIAQRFRLRSFTEDMEIRGLTSTSKMLWNKRSPAGARLGARLQVSPTEEIITMRRLRLADGEPMALELLSVPISLIPDLDPAILADRSFYEYLRSEHGVVIVGGTQTMEPTVLDADEAELLAVPPLSPALLVERVTWTDTGRRVEAVRSVYRGDRYKFHLDLTPGETRT